MKIRFRGWIGLETNMMFEDIQDNPRHLDLETFSDWLHCRAAHVMQYTGMSDKNNKEICAKDILRMDEMSPTIEYHKGHRFMAYSHKSVTGVVHLEPGGFYVEFPSGYTAPLHYVMSSSSEYHDVEVIGNIYENPELYPEEED